MTDTPKTEDPMVAALLRERAGYVGRKGKEDRVEAVDEQLRLRGYSPDGDPITEATTEGSPQNKPSTPPKGRQARTPDKA